MKQTIYAVPIKGSSVFHIPDEVGFPACLSESLPPVYAVDTSRKLHYLLVPVARRCVASGCADRWSR